MVSSTSFPVFLLLSLLSGHANTNQTPNEEGRISYNGTQVLRVEVETDEDLDAVIILAENEEVSIWSMASNSSTADILVKPDKLETVKEYLAINNITYTVFIDDVEDAIRLENPELSDEEMDGLAGKVVDFFIDPPSMASSYDQHKCFVETGCLVINETLSGDHHVSNNAMEQVKQSYVCGTGMAEHASRHRMTWQSYHRMTDIHGYLEYLARTYPDLCTIETIGNSIEGKPLKVLKIASDNQGNSAVWVDGGIHAREWISPATVTYIINELVVNRNAQSEAMRNINWYVHPLVNPDGYEHTHQVDRLWRKNRNRSAGRCVGVDLNRNFIYKWGGAGSSKQPCKEIYAGTGGFSEPETAAISQFVSSRASTIKAYVTFHSYGQYILYPWGYDRTYPPDYKDLDRVARKMAQAIYKTGGSSYTVGSAATTLYPAAGGSDDWAKGIAKIKYTYTIELRDRGYHGFVLPASHIVPTAKEALSALSVLAEEVKTS